MKKMSFDPLLLASRYLVLKMKDEVDVNELINRLTELFKGIQDEQLHGNLPMDYKLTWGHIGIILLKSELKKDD
jgi:hypothetical protein